MNVKEFNAYRDILAQCYKHQTALEEVLADRKKLSFSAIRQAQELHRRNEELISNIHAVIKGDNSNEVSKPTTSAEIIPLFD